jgi:L-ascorbate metabolism protein UlaG (beta-lactamase superfamily)
MIRATFARLLGTILALLMPAAAFATCVPVAGTTPEIMPAAFRPTALPAAGEVRITFLGHASFLLETPGGATAVTDFNGYVRAAETPTLVTMNNAHSTHYTEVLDPAIEHVLRGWDPGGGIAVHDVKVEDMRVRNVPTNVREFGGTRYAGNSIFVFEVADLCIAHLGHLHHLLTDEHLGKLGVIDILMVPVDGSYTIQP